MPTKTRWGAVAVLFIAGVIAALQIGKAAIALPTLTRELALSLVMASWIIGAYGFLGAVAGLPAGILSSLFSARRAVLAGLMTAGLGSVLGALTDSGLLMIATRVIEGCGFLAVSLAVPRLLRAVTAPKDLDVVMPLFGAYLPTGSVAMMLAGPHLLAAGWQALWWANGASALFWVLVVARLDVRESSTVETPVTALGANVRAALWTPGPILLALIFGTYTFQYMALAGLLPTLLVDRAGLSITNAATISAFAVAANAAGNVSAGALLRLGIPTWVIAAGSFGFVGLAGFGIFSETMPVTAVAILAAASLGLTGLIPGSIYATAPKFAASSALLAIVLGLINQTTNLGNLLGPVVTAMTVESFGWQRASLVFFGVGVTGVAWALLLRFVMRRTPQN